jgi:Leucine Rich repeat
MIQCAVRFETCLRGKPSCQCRLAGNLRPVKLVDGSTVSIPDTEANQAEYSQLGSQQRESRSDDKTDQRLAVVWRSGWIYARLRVHNLIVVALAAVVLGYAALGLFAARVQRDAVRSIVNAGGSVEYRGPLSHGGPNWDPGAWYAVGRSRPMPSTRGPLVKPEPWWPPWLVTRLGTDYFDTVVRVSISGGYGSDAEMYQIGRLPELAELSASGSPLVTDRGLAYIKGLRKLRVLSIHSLYQVTDAGLIHLKDLKNLESLFLASANVSDAGLVHLQGLSELKVLDLRNNPRVDGSGFARLTGLTKLSWLLLDGSGLKDAGMAKLKCLTSLRYLNVSDTCVTDAGLAHLSCLTGLQYLDIVSTRVSDAGALQFQKALPKTIVRH